MNMTEKMLEAILRSRPDYEDCPVKQLAFELAFELEEADLSANDLVTINREKLEAIAARVVKRQAALASLPRVTREELSNAVYQAMRLKPIVSEWDIADAILTRFPHLLKGE